MAAGKMMSYINKVLQITTDDGRDLSGKLIVFDRHMNVVLSDVTEKRVVGQGKTKSTAERKLGLVLLRGEHVVSLRAEKPLGDSSTVSGLPKGTGVVKKARLDDGTGKRSREE
jgi:small nuclear ribonucleoprotein B and B'